MNPSANPPPPRQKCIINTGARLHFGLLDTASPFGGIGMMISDPRTSISSVKEIDLEGIKVRVTTEVSPLDEHERAQAVYQRLVSTCPEIKLAACIEVLQRPRAHTGLGSGTQLNLAIAESLAWLAGATLSHEELSIRIAGRGLRSAVGIHGYWQGGFLYERALDDHTLATERRVNAKTTVISDDTSWRVNPLLARVETPTNWRIVLLKNKKGPLALVSGQGEESRFKVLPRPDKSIRNALIDRIESQIIPALQSGDFEAFCESVYQYNYTSGTFFAPVQGGPYNGDEVAFCIDCLRTYGFYGSGQSSWGPTVFVFCSGEEMVGELLKFVHDRLQNWEVDCVATPHNNPRQFFASE